MTGEARTEGYLRSDPPHAKSLSGRGSGLPRASVRSGPAWFAAETLPRAEAQAERNLRQQGFTALCPRFLKGRRHARRLDQVLTPLFPGYLFVRFDRDADHWRSINGTLGVRRLVGVARKTPHPVPEDVIDALAARCDNGVLRCVMPELQPGKEIRILSGPFTDRLATITRLDPAGRVAVLLEILGRPTSVVIPAAQIGQL